MADGVGMRNKPMIVGLTGGIGSGKTLVSNHLASLGAVVIDADEVAHRVTAPGGPAIEAIRAAFGADSLNADGSLNRDAMRQRVFDTPSERTRLEAIVHPVIRQTMLEALNAVPPTTYAVLVVPLLIEKGGWAELTDRIVVVDCPVETQIARVKARNGWPDSQIQAVLAAQASRTQRLAKADHVIVNDGEISQVLTQVQQLHELLKKIKPN